MAVVTNIYTLYAIVIDGLVIDQVTDFRLSRGISLLVQSADGLVNPSFVAIGKIAPQINFITTNLKGLLDKIATPWQGLQIADGVESPVVAYFQQVDAFGTRKSGANHISLTMANAMVIPITINSADGQAAAMVATVFPIHDGSANDPIVPSASASLAGSPAIDLLWTCGPVKVNNATVENGKYTGQQSFALNFGVNAVPRGGDGKVYNEFIAIEEARPTIQAEYSDGRLLSDIGLLGTKQGATDSVFYLTKIDRLGTRVANNVAGHVSFGLDDGLFHVPEVGGAHPGILGSTLIATPAYDGSAPQIAISTATTIT